MAIFQRVLPGSKLMKLNYEWNVEFPCLQSQEKNLEKINSPRFCHEQTPVNTWFISLSDEGVEISLRMLFCHKGQVGPLPYPLLAKISILNKKRNKVLQQLQSAKPSSLWLVFDFDKEMLILSDGQQENGSLTFLIKLKYHLKKETVFPANTRDNEMHGIYGFLSTNQHKMFEEMQFTDVIFLIGEREFPAHKSILASRSTVFTAMFKSASDENSIKKIPIQDIEPEVFQELLRFMYTGIVLFDKMESCAVGLFIASKTFSLRELTEKCENFLLFHMSPPHCLQLLLHGDLANPSKHVSEAANFFRRNAVEVMGTDGWKKAKEENPISLVKIHEFLYCQRK